MSVGQTSTPPLGEPAQYAAAVEKPLSDGQPATRRGWWLPSVAALAAVAMFMLVRESLTDDGYITLAYAKNLAMHGEWGIVPGSPANSATSPLNVLLLGALTLATRISGAPHPVLALGILNVLASATIGWGWMRLMRAFRLPTVAAVLGIALILINPFVLSATGLEVLLIPAVLIVLTVFAVEGRPALFGVAAGLTLLTRLDLLLFVVLIAFSAAAIRRRLTRAVSFTALVAGPWFVFSWFAFGSAVPDTLVIKHAQAGLFAPWSYFTGPVMYFLGKPATVLLAFAPALAGLFALAGWFGLRFGLRWKEFPPFGPVAGLGAGGVAYYVVYSFIGVGPYHWYYVTPIVAMDTFAVAASGIWLTYARERPRVQPWAPVVALGLIGMLALSNVAIDGKQGVPWRSPVIFGNWASAHDYARVGQDLGKRLHGATVASPGEIGTLAYFCDCAILDEFSDRGQVATLVNKGIARSSQVTSIALRANYLWFDRSRRPRVADYRLEYGSGPASGPDTWQVYSAAKGVGHFTLVPAS